MDILELVGNTPVIELKKIFNAANGVSLFAKAEYFNPSGSVKDRAAKAMILHGINSGQLTKDKIILDSTSGNTGIAYAMFGAALGYRVQLFMPANASEERKKIIRSFGAKIIETDPLEGSDGAYRMVMELAQKEPDLYFFPNQYDNFENPRTHYETTGLEGMKHMESTIQPKIFDKSIADSHIKVKTEDAYMAARRLAVEEGLFVGISSGANVYAAMELAKTLPAGSRIATILCDNGYRYLSQPLWRDLV
jgi:cysteine synthase B